MEFENQTPYAAHLFRGVVDEETLLAVAVCRLGCLVRHGKLEPQDIQEQVRTAPAESPAGPLPPDDAPLKPGVDVVVLGQAVAPGGRAVRELAVALEVGPHQRQLRVVGNRTWRVRPGVDLQQAVERSRAGDHDLEALVATRPEPFETMPLTWSLAFGGQAGTAQGPLPYTANPEGLGYQVELDHAVGAPLPNLEDPEHPVQHWRDWVDPVCLAPLPPGSSLRLTRGVKPDLETMEIEILPEYFLVAPTGQCHAAVPAGCPITVHGMHADGPLSFEVPELPARVKVAVGADRLELPCTLDTIEIWPNDRRVSFVMRAAFRYPFRREETRTAQLVLDPTAGRGS